MSLYWSPPVELSSEGEWLLSHCKKRCRPAHRPQGTAHSPASICRRCRLREQCTTASGRGRTVSIHPQEPFFVELRSKQKTTRSTKSADSAGLTLAGPGENDRQGLADESEISRQAPVVDVLHVQVHPLFE